MSALPAAFAQAGQMTVMNPLDVLISGINTNPYFIGIMMLLLNLGGRFLSLEISKDQEKFLSQPVVRRFFLFAVLFVATRNILVAAGLAFLVILVLGYLFNENSSLCLWKSCSIPPLTQAEGQPEGFAGLSAEEAMILKRLQDKQMAAAEAVRKQKEEGVKEEEKKSDTASDYYSRAMVALKGLV